LKGLLVNAAGWNVDRSADISPIRALLDQGCDPEADVARAREPRRAQFFSGRGSSGISRATLLRN
jgi:hypothetical protein